MTIRFITTFFLLSAVAPLSIAQQASTTTQPEQETILKKRNSYQQRLALLESYRAEQQLAYNSASNTKKAAILKQVKTKLESELTEHLFPAWYGTQWDFNGTSNKPGEGKIACGYFVSTCLKHIGFKVNRFKLAQQPSQRIIKTFVPRTAMDISSQRSLADIKKQLSKSGDGIYIVGLDRHVGYVSVKGEKINFIHSSYYGPKPEVKSEPYDSKNPLADSKYRVFGKLFHDQMLINWLNQKPYVVKR